MLRIDKNDDPPPDWSIWRGRVTQSLESLKEMGVRIDKQLTVIYTELHQLDLRLTRQEVKMGLIAGIAGMAGAGLFQLILRAI